MIELDNVSFTYRGGESDAVRALTDVDLKLESGQFVAIIGQNGSGKSTLVKLLTAILYPTEGDIQIDGVPVDKLREVGLDVPLAASLAHRLRARGIPIGEDILNTSDLCAALSATVDPSP